MGCSFSSPDLQCSNINKAVIDWLHSGLSTLETQRLDVSNWMTTGTYSVQQLGEPWHCPWSPVWLSGATGDSIFCWLRGAKCKEILAAVVSTRWTLCCPVSETFLSLCFLTLASCFGKTRICVCLATSSSNIGTFFCQIQWTDNHGLFICGIILAKIKTLMVPKAELCYTSCLGGCCSAHDSCEQWSTLSKDC